MQYIELRKKGNYLGRTGEEGRKTVFVDATKWNESAGGGSGILLYTSPTGQVWPLGSVTETDEETGTVKISAPITRTETAVAGNGHIEAQWMSGGEVVKSVSYNTLVLESAYTGETVPDNTPHWVKELIEELNAAGTLLEELGEVASEARGAYEDVSAAAQDIDRALHAADELVEDVQEVLAQTEEIKEQTNAYKTAAAASATAAAASAEQAMDATPEGYAAFVGSMAQAYSAAQAYAVGDLALKDGQLYRCVSAIGEEGEAWTAGHWTAVTVGGEVGNLKTALQKDSDIVSANLMGIDAQENLYPGAADWSGVWENSDAEVLGLSNDVFMGYPVMYSSQSYRRIYKEIPVTAGKKYTFEAWIKHSVAGSLFLYLIWNNHTTNPATISEGIFKQWNNRAKDTWIKLSYTFTVTASGNISPYAYSGAGAFYVAKYQLTEGEAVFSLTEALNGKASTAELNAVKEKTDAIQPQLNLLDGLTQTESKVYERTTANVADNEYCNIYPQIPIENGKTYYYRNIYGYFCVIKYTGGSNVNLSSDQATTLDGSFTASDNGVICISTRKGKTGFVFTNSKALYDSGLVSSFNTIDAQNIPKIYHVEKDGSGDFDSLVEAIEEATKYMDSIVYVGAGTWDIIEELGAEYVESVSSIKRGVYLKNRIHLIFNPKAVVECIYTGSRADTIAWLSAFNAGQYGFTLEGANIITENIRYSVHDERDQDADAYTNVYRNCIMYHNSSYEQGGQNQCIGGGLGLNGHIVIDGCVFENPQKENTGLVSYHNSAGSNAKSLIDVHGCYVKGTNTMRFRYYGATPSTQKTTILCHGNSLGANILFGPETEGSANENMELLTWNNEIRSN